MYRIYIARRSIDPEKGSSFLGLGTALEVMYLYDGLDQPIERWVEEMFCASPQSL